MRAVPPKGKKRNPNKRKAAERIRIALWNAERFGGSTEGQWKDGKYTGNDPAYTNKKIQNDLSKEKRR